MEPKIVELDEIKIVGMQSFGVGTKGELLEIWDVFQRNGIKIPNLKSRKYYYGVEPFTREFDENKKWFYLAGAEVKDFSKVPVQMTAKVLPKNKYVVFEYQGAVKGLGSFYEKIYMKWLPELGLENAAPYDFERYDKRFISPQSEKSIIDIFIPVKKKRANGV